MKIQIRARNVKVTKALRDHVDLRLGFALSRFGEHISHVAVHLSKSEERQDKEEKRCQIVINLRRCVKVQETDADLFTAISRAVIRAARRVAQSIKKEQEQLESASQRWMEDNSKSLMALPAIATKKSDIKYSRKLKKICSSGQSHK